MTYDDEGLEAALRRFEEGRGIISEGGALVYDNIRGYKKGNDWTFVLENQSTLNDANVVVARDYTDYSTVYGPSYVGNSKLTELNKLIVDDKTGLDQVTELAAILRDFPEDSLSKYLSLDDDGRLLYEGKGIYTFDLYGKTYYATESDLIDSYNSAIASNTIDIQSKLNYYNAANISKKIEETNQALLETDASGRFTSVKFDNDSITYLLDVKEVTNDAAYNSAMNDYLYKKAQYEKTIADINAQTSIIQQEDRTLELRLKQLDTEQNALATEMDAVKKVIKDNVEKTFKTFSD